ncbi:MAG: hypothetical protein GY946_33905 [bacterium]|nr:hypothetical protein [bacterium]
MPYDYEGQREDRDVVVTAKVAVETAPRLEAVTAGPTGVAVVAPFVAAPVAVVASFVPTVAMPGVMSVAPTVAVAVVVSVVSAVVSAVVMSGVVSVVSTVAMPGVASVVPTGVIAVVAARAAVVVVVDDPAPARVASITVTG